MSADLIPRALKCDVCGKPPWWSLSRLGDPCPDDDGHLISRVSIEGPVDEPGFKGYKLFLDGKHISTHRLKGDAINSASEALRNETD